MFYTAPEVEREVTRRDKKGDWEAGKRVKNCEYKNMIDSPMIHHEMMQLRNRLPAFLKLTQNMIKTQPALPRGPDAPATHTYPADPAPASGVYYPRYSSRRRSWRRGSIGVGARRKQGRWRKEKRIGSRRDVVRAAADAARRERRYGYPDRRRCICVGGDFGVADGPVVLAYDIDAEFLLWLIRTSKRLSGVRISDLRLYHLI